MEKLPLGERSEPRMVGPGSLEAKKETNKNVQKRFGKEHLGQFTKEQLEKLKAEEREKTGEEKEDICVADEITNGILREFELPEFDVSLENVHFISKKLWEERYGRKADLPAASSSPEQQAIFVNSEYKKPEGRVHMATTILHELIHLKGHLSVEVDSEEDRDIYRSGLVTLATYKKMKRSRSARWFDGLNEAVVTEMEGKYSDRALRANSYLKDEVAWLDSPEAKRLKEEHAKKKGIDPSEIEWISRDGKDVYYQSYYWQRKVLNYIVDQIYECGNFQSREDIMKLFFAAHFKNSLLPIGRLVEKTFGQGSFRELGNMDIEPGSPSTGRVLDSLMKRRRNPVR